jgi:hypothetical protein
MAKLKYKNGNLTTTGLRRGYIQVSPFYPNTRLYLTYDYDHFIVKGYNERGKAIVKSFLALKDARKFLFETK